MFFGESFCAKVVRMNDSFSTGRVQEKLKNFQEKSQKSSTISFKMTDERLIEPEKGNQLQMLQVITCSILQKLKKLKKIKVGIYQKIR